MPVDVRDVSATYAAIMRNPAAPAGDVCRICRGFIARGRDQCAGCARLPPRLDLVVPVSYSVGGGPLHRELRGYKDDPSEAARDLFTRGLSALLWRFLAEHEACVAIAAGAAAFGLVTAVPSRTRRNDETRWRLRRIVGSDCRATSSRYARVLMAADRPAEGHRWDPDRYLPVKRVKGADVLLIDDTWTSGASAQGAAHALKRAGAGRVALVVLGRHVNPDYSDHAARLRALPPFDWGACAVSRHRAGTPAQDDRSRR